MPSPARDSGWRLQCLLNGGSSDQISSPFRIDFGKFPHDQKICEKPKDWRSDRFLKVGSNVPSRPDVNKNTGMNAKMVGDSPLRKPRRPEERVVFVQNHGLGRRGQCGDDLDDHHRYDLRLGVGLHLCSKPSTNSDICSRSTVALIHESSSGHYPCHRI